MASHFGFLCVNKPSDVTSRQVVDVAARLVRPERAGHAGTLDPLATGVLVIALGRATRLVPYVQQLPKTYAARFLLGRRSNTDDVTGEMTFASNVTPPTESEIRDALTGFVGRIEQVPPLFSAVHVEGRRAYKLARRGADIEIPPREVEVHRIELLSYSFPEVEAEIECGSGTYIRSIGRDLGEHLGCGAVMSALVRTRVGPFHLENSCAPEDLSAETLPRCLLPAALAVAEYPQRKLTETEVEDIRQGRRAAWGDADVPSGDLFPVALLTPQGELAALARYDGAQRNLAPKQVFLPRLPT